jgi:UDP-N-acetylglucosamine--N-acetylmuramyl-(pentapeptide) pyrophosphoryl-undecaprenol N-acetylglucosamine transferase
VDEALSSLAPFFAARSLEVWHQSRPENIATVQKAYESCSVKAKVETFIQDILSAYTWADIIISRAGAGSVMEIGIANRPAILIPLATSSGGHQRDNALLLAQSGKAVIVDEGPTLLGNLQRALDRYLDVEEYFRVLELPNQSRSLGAAKHIADECRRLLD